MNNIDELSQDLRTLYRELRGGTVDIKLATELNNTAGKIIGAHKVQLAYHALRGEKPDIPFLAAKECAPAISSEGEPRQKQLHA